ncbi:GNAT family N-acetyltransferase [Mycobacterium sp. Y57]|nr:GNAT family N-acetyltransferase [Mycolicibacterium xanthum]
MLPATVEQLTALQSDPARFGRLIGSAVPVGWPEFPESVGYTLDRLREHPEEADWWMHFFMSGGILFGSGGFAGPPDQGVVEIGYELAPGFRGRGLGVAAARAMLDKAAAHGTVSMVVANTLPQENPSTGVLRRLGFMLAGEREDPDVGTTWHWERPLTSGRNCTT